MTTTSDLDTLIERLQNYADGADQGRAYGVQLRKLLMETITTLRARETRSVVPMSQDLTIGASDGFDIVVAMGATGTRLGGSVADALDFGQALVHQAMEELANRVRDLEAAVQASDSQDTSTTLEYEDARRPLPHGGDFRRSNYLGIHAGAKVRDRITRRSMTVIGLENDFVACEWDIGGERHTGVFKPHEIHSIDAGCDHPGAHDGAAGGRRGPLHGEAVPTTTRP